MTKKTSVYPGYSESEWKPRFASTTIEFVDPEQLLAHPDNHRIHVQLQQAQVEKLLDVLGWVDVVKVNKRTGCVVDGHLRVTLAIRHKTPVPVLWLDLSEAEERAALTSLDYTASKAGLDLSILATNLDFMQIEFPALDVVWENFKLDFELNGNANGAGGDEPQDVDETEAERLAKEYGVQVGDVWRLGRHTIACIDCLDAEKVNEIISTQRIAMLFSDPPYGVNIVATNVSVGGGESADGMIPFGGKKRNGYVGGGERIKASPGLYPLEAREKAKRLRSSHASKPFGSEKVRGTVGSANLIEVGKYAPVIGDENQDTAKRAAAYYLSVLPAACHVWWGANYYTDVLTPSPGWIVWDKDNTGNFADCEMAWTNQPRAARIFEHRWNGMLKATEQGQRRVHPTQKPVALADYVFREYGKAGDVILDPFMGSGITVLAAETMSDRTVIGFELSPAYIGVTIKRWEVLTGEKALLMS